MAEATKHPPIPIHGGSFTSDLMNLFKAKKTVAFAYGFMLAFVAFTVFLAFHPSPNASSPWFVNIFSTSTTTATSGTTAQPNFPGSPFSSIFSYFFPNSSSSPRVYDLVSSSPPSSQPDRFRSSNVTSQTPNLNKQITDSTASQNQTQSTLPTNKEVLPSKSQTVIPFSKPQVLTNQTANFSDKSPSSSIFGNPDGQNATQSTGKAMEAKVLKANQTAIGSQGATIPKPSPEDIDFPKVLPKSGHNSSSLVQPASSSKNRSEKGHEGVLHKDVSSNYTASLSKKQSNGVNPGVSVKQKKVDFDETLMKCNLYDGEWVKDDSYPLYKPGSCPIIDEQFGCIVNGRPDTDYQKYKWKPKQCNIPRLDGSHMLEMLRGKRLVFVGDSLNRNMWESLVCILRNSVKDKSKVFEANGRQYFRGEAAYSFIFQDYNCSIELYVSPFLVQEWEMPDKNGSKKETLRLDLVGKTSDQYKGADILIFNTGHWWTHEKTSLGKDYYQEGSHVYGELNVLEAFRKALTTWARWVDANVNPLKSMVLFRGYSASHFSGGQWNSGGQCDHETVPIKNETYLREHPPKMRVLERVLKGMKTHVSYMNITRMTDFRKDGHPSMYRKQNLTEAERRSPLRYQDCSHWCLPGVPDAWNEILYAEILRRQKLNHQKQKTP